MHDDEKNKIQNLTREDAVKKIKELAEGESICMFVTNLDQKPLNGRPMATQQVDDSGNLWFLSARSSDKNHDIESDNRVQLFYCNKGSSEYLSIYGYAEIVFDRSKIEELWNPLVKVWFKEGKDDPEISIIKVIPEDVYYWDTKNNKMITLVKLAASVVSGKTMDNSVEGTLKVK